MIGYEYSHSAPDGNGLEFISFMVSPHSLDENGLLEGVGVMIIIDNIKQRSSVYQCRWARGAPRDLRLLLTLEDDVLGDADLPSIVERLKIKVEAPHSHIARPKNKREE